MVSSKLIHSTPSSNSNFTDQLTKRISFIGITLLALILNFALFSLINLGFKMIQSTELGSIILYWLSLAISTMCAIFFTITVANRMNINNPTGAIPPCDCLRVKSSTIGLQIKWAIVLLCIFYVPLDFVFYLIPGILDFSASTVTSNFLGLYFTWTLPLMIGTALIVHFFVAFREELYFRHFLISEGTRRLGPTTAFIYSGILFGAGHFYYILSPSAQGYSPLYPLLWGLSACFIGLVSGYFFLKKKQLWPIIIAHWLNNVISAIAIHNHLVGIAFIETTLYIYLPLMILGFGFLIYYRKRIKTAFQDIIQIIKQYNIENASQEESIKVNTAERSTPSEEKKELTTQESISMLLLDLFIIILISIGTLLLF